jgi:CBS domain-containing protein
MELSKVPVAREYMTPAEIVLHPDMSVYEAIDRLIAAGVSGAPVINGGGVVGILTEKDCLRVLSMSHLYNITGGKVSDFMSDLKMRVDPDMDLLTVASKFLATNFTVLPVVEGERLVGKITRSDMLRGIQEIQLMRKKELEREKGLQRYTERPSSIEGMQNLVANHNKEQIATVFAKEHNKR